jgi:hypothetical protein
MFGSSHSSHRSTGYRITNLVTQKNSRNFYRLEYQVNTESTALSLAQRKNSEASPEDYNAAHSRCRSAFWWATTCSLKAVKHASTISADSR